MTFTKTKALQLASEHEELYHLMKYHSLALLNGKARQPLVISFTSYHAGEGVSTQVVNFALTLSQEPEMRILLVDFNLKRPALHRFFASEDLSVASDPVDAASDPAPPTDERIINGKELVRHKSGLDVIITRQHVTHFPDSGISKEGIELFIQKARERYDYILIDSPPLYYDSFAHLLAIQADYTVLVVKAHGVRGHALREEIAQLDRLGANILGVILNMREYPIPQWIYRLVCGGSK